MSLMSVSINLPSMGDSRKIRLAERAVQLLFSPISTVVVAADEDAPPPLMMSAISVDDVDGNDMSNRLRQLPSSITAGDDDDDALEDVGFEEPDPLMLVILSSRSLVR